MPRRPRLCHDISQLSVSCFSFPFSKVGMILMTSPGKLWEASCHQLWDRTASKLSEVLLFPNSGKRATLPSQHRLLCREHFKGSCWHPQQRPVHQRLRSALYHNAGHRRSPRSHTPPAQSQPGGAGQVRRQKRQSQPCSTQDERESVSICKTTRLGSFLFAEHQTGLKRHFSAHSTRKNIPGKSL